MTSPGPVATPSVRSRRAVAATMGALFIAALSLRPNLHGLGPLLPSIADELAVDYGTVGLLATIPVLCMGLVSPFAARLAHGIGARRGIAVALVVLAAAGVARSLGPDAVSIVLLTLPIGLAIGGAGALLPVIIKERLPMSGAAATGAYSMAIQLGASIASFSAVPIAVATTGWRGSLAVFSLVAVAALVAWLALTRGAVAGPREPVPAGSGDAGEPGAGLPAAEALAADERLRRTLPGWSAWRDPMVWWLAVLYWLCAFPYYGIIAWLAASLVERGWDPAAAGALVSVVPLSGLPGSLLIGMTIDRLGSRRATMVAWAAVMTVAVAGFVVLPDLALLWAIVGGLAIGATFTLTLILPLDIAPTAATSGPVFGVVLCVGYLLVALTPVLTGVVRDVTGSFDASLWVLVLASALVLPASLPLTRARLGGR